MKKCFAPKRRHAENALRIDGHGVRPKISARLMSNGYFPSLLALAGVFLAAHATAQESIHNILNRSNAGGFQEAEGNQPYTFKIKDLSVLASASFGMDYNDNINVSKTATQSDLILSPRFNVNGLYPLTDRNVLTLNAGVGYNEYIEHSTYSGLSLSSGSGVGFDIGIGDFQINLHDRFSYSQDAGSQPLVAGNGNGHYGNASNAVGINTDWDLGDITLTFGYDHDNTFSPSQTAQIYQSQDHSSDVFFARSGFHLNSDLTTGLEGTGTFTTYDQRVLNNNSAYSIGVFADWQPGDFHFTPRVGYSINDFQQTSSSIRTGGSDSWYADLTGGYQLTKAISTSLSLGHEVSAGIESDAVETWYLRPQLNWGIIDGGTLGLGLSYEKGNQGVGNQSGNLTETFNYYASNVSFSYALTRKTSLALNDRLVFRSSSNSARDYTQNVIGLQLTYTFD